MRGLLKRLLPAPPYTALEIGSIGAILGMALWAFILISKLPEKAEIRPAAAPAPASTNFPITQTITTPAPIITTDHEIVLLETRMTSRSDGQLAILRIDSGPRLVVSEGSEVQAGIELLKVTQEFALLRVNGRETILALPNGTPPTPALDDGSGLAIAEKTGDWPAESAANPVPDP